MGQVTGSNSGIFDLYKKLDTMENQLGGYG